MVFARWTAVGALSPFMQLHGRANITPWTVPDHVDETVALYRYWATLHDELGPFWYSLAVEGAILHPIGDAGDYRWMLGDALLVAPILDATDGRTVDLPDGTWYDWWDGTAYVGPTTITVTGEPRDRIPLYVKEGAILPMEIGNDATGLGTTASAGALTVLVWPMYPGGTTMILHEEGETDNGAITVSGGSSGAAQIELSVTGQPVIVRAHAPVAPTQVNGSLATIPEVADRDSVLAATGDAWWYDAAAQFLWVRVADGNGTQISW
jgi:alpha-D-xyloside xylohydrolase